MVLVVVFAAWVIVAPFVAETASTIRGAMVVVSPSAELRRVEEASLETGHTVVVTMTSLVTFPIFAGQSVTSGLQEVTVYTEVILTVEVVIWMLLSTEPAAFEGRFDEVLVEAFFSGSVERGSGRTTETVSLVYDGDMVILVGWPLPAVSEVELVVVSTALPPDVLVGAKMPGVLLADASESSDSGETATVC
jgi:hypothetical protein